MKRGLGLGVLIVLCACGGRSVRNEIILTGSVESDPVRVSPLVGGRLLEVAAVEGTRVGAGGIIARIDATDLELQLFLASPDQDGVKKEVAYSTSLFVVKDCDYNVHLYPYHWSAAPKQLDLLDTGDNVPAPVDFGREL